MTKLGLFGAAAVILSSALAGPTMAQQVVSNPGYCAQFYPNANCQNNGPGNPYTGDYQRRIADRNSGNWDSNGRDRRDTGFWPGDVAAGAVGTAAEIATSPFRGDDYAYYNSGPTYNDSYAARNAFVCQPGTWFRGEDGRRHICQ